MERAGVGNAGFEAERSDGPTLMGENAAMAAVVRYVNRVAGGDGTVLITGETGYSSFTTPEGGSS